MREAVWWIALLVAGATLVVASGCSSTGRPPHVLERCRLVYQQEVDAGPRPTDGKGTGSVGERAEDAVFRELHNRATGADCDAILEYLRGRVAAAEARREPDAYWWPQLEPFDWSLASVFLWDRLISGDAARLTALLAIVPTRAVWPVYIEYYLATAHDEPDPLFALKILVDAYDASEFPCTRDENAASIRRAFASLMEPRVMADRPYVHACRNWLKNNRAEWDVKINYPATIEPREPDMPWNTTPWPPLLVRPDDPHAWKRFMREAAEGRGAK